MADEWGVCVWENGRNIYEARVSESCEPTRECETDKQRAAKDGEFSQTQATQNTLNDGADGFEKMMKKLKNAKHKEA